MFTPHIRISDTLADDLIAIEHGFASNYHWTLEEIKNVPVRKRNELIRKLSEEAERIRKYTR